MGTNIDDCLLVPAVVVFKAMTLTDKTVVILNSSPLPPLPPNHIIFQAGEGIKLPLVINPFEN